MLHVVAVLDLAPFLGHIYRLEHRVGHVLGIEQRLAIHVTRRTTDRLNQGTLRPQKALFIGIQNRHERHLR